MEERINYFNKTFNNFDKWEFIEFLDNNKIDLEKSVKMSISYLDVNPKHKFPLMLSKSGKIFKFQKCQIIKHLLKTKNDIIFEEEYLWWIIDLDIDELEQFSKENNCYEYFKLVIQALFLYKHSRYESKEKISRTMFSYIKETLVETIYYDK